MAFGQKMAKKTSWPFYGLMGWEHNRSPQKQTLGIIPKSNQSKIDAQHRLICPIDQFACANGLTCIPEKSLCNGVDDCEDQ